MIYIRKFILPSERAENLFIENEKRTCFSTFYPFKIFTDKGLGAVELGDITMIYGGNGSGKSTLLNVIAHKIGAERYSEFNDAPFFDKYVQMCSVDYARSPRESCILSSDDVFDYALKARAINEGIDDKRNELFRQYADVKAEAVYNRDILKFRGLDDYERWKTTMEILSPKRSQSSYIKKRVAPDIDLHSNGETAMKYFLERIDGDALYLIDEPENSLSIQFQAELADYICASVRATRSQFIIATHSPVFLSIKGSTVYNLDDYPAGICKWTDLPNVRRYFEFFMDHKDEFDL